MVRRKATLVRTVLHATAAVVALCFAWPCAPLRAQSTTPTFSLNWVRGEGAERCASSQQLARAVEQRLGPVLRNASEATLAIEGTVTQSEPGLFEVRTRVLTPRGEVLGVRTLQRKTTDCSTLTPAIVLVLSLTTDPAGAAYGFPTEALARLSDGEDPGPALLSELSTQRDAPSPASTEVTKAVNAAPQRTKLGPPREEQRRNRWGGALQVGAGVSGAVLPDVSFGPSLAAHLITPWPIELRLGAAYWAPATVSIDSLGERKAVHFSAASGQLTLCVPLRVGSSWQLAPCLGGVLGLRWVDADALQQDAAARRPYGGPLAQLSWRYAFAARWFAALDLSAALLFPRDHFTYRDIADEAQVLFRPQLAAVWSALSVGVRL